MIRNEHHPAGCRRILMHFVHADNRWFELQSIAAMAGLSQTGASARIRDLRKRPWNLTVEARPAKRPGPWEYRVDAKAAARALKGIK